jgi:hypothetical protein
VLEFSGSKVRGPDPDRLRVFASFGTQLGQFIERTQAEQALHESRAMLEAVVDGTSDAVFVKDREGRYLLINEAGAAALGRHRHAPDPAAGAEVRAGGDPHQLAVQVGHVHLAAQAGAGEPRHPGEAGAEAGAGVQAAEPEQLLAAGGPEGDAHLREDAAGLGLDSWSVSWLGAPAATAPKRRWRVW